MSDNLVVDPGVVDTTGQMGGAGDASIGGAGNPGQSGPQAGSSGARASSNFKKDLDEEEDDDDDRKQGRERRKIEIKFIQDKSRRHITFSKRKAGIMKKAYELSVLTGTQVLLLVVSETGLVYTFTTPKLQPLVTKSEGKNLIQACLNAPDEPHEAQQQQQQQQMHDPQQVPMPQPGPPPQAPPAAQQYISPEQAAAYNQYLGMQHPGVQPQPQRGYAMPPHMQRPQ